MATHVAGTHLQPPVNPGVPTCSPRSRAPCSRSATIAGVTSARAEMHTRCGCSLPLSCKTGVVSGREHWSRNAAHAYAMPFMPCVSLPKHGAPTPPSPLSPLSPLLTSQAAASGRLSTTDCVICRMAPRSQLQGAGEGCWAWVEEGSGMKAVVGMAAGAAEFTTWPVLKPKHAELLQLLQRIKGRASVLGMASAHPSSSVRAHWWSSCHTVPVAVPRVPPCKPSGMKSQGVRWHIVRKRQQLLSHAAPCQRRLPSASTQPAHARPRTLPCPPARPGARSWCPLR